MAHKSLIAEKRDFGIAGRLCHPDDESYRADDTLALPAQRALGIEPPRFPDYCERTLSRMDKGQHGFHSLTLHVDGPDYSGMIVTSQPNGSGSTQYNLVLRLAPEAVRAIL